MFENIDLKVIKKRESGKRDRSSKDEECSYYFPIQNSEEP
jgi:hypothetical protein